MLAAWSKSALVEHDVIRETGMPKDRAIPVTVTPSW
jgi:hypothetical protein